MFKERIESLYSGTGTSREYAWKKAWSLGFPDRKTESYRKISLQPLLKYAVLQKGEELLDLAQIPKPVIALPMEEARKTYALFLENRIKQRVAREHDFFAALNDAVYEKGYFIYVPPNAVVEEPIDLKFNYSGAFSHFAPHIQICVGRGAAARFNFSSLFTYFESGLITAKVDIYLDRDAQCDVIDDLIIPNSALYVNSLRATLKKGSKLNVWSVTKGSSFLKQDFKVELLEEDSEVSLKGAAFLTESKVSHTQVLIEHKAPNATSRQHFKAVMNDKSSSTFEGKIYVEPEAQKTEAYQLNNNLLLGKESSCFSKPGLEIFADDVKASHGATVAKLSEEELFYFQTRGISKELAGSYLATGFLDEIIKELPHWHLIRNW